MDELMLHLSQMFPREYLLDKLKEKITEHNITQTDESYKEILGVCHILLMKDVVENKGIKNVLNQVKTIDSFMKYVDPDKAKDNG